MKEYRPNSPEAMARLLSMFILSDGDAQDSELVRLDQLNLLDAIGISSKRFLEVFKEYCDDISDEADENGTIHLIDTARVDALLEDITERSKRILVCALALDLCKADAGIGEVEMALLRHMMQRWNLSLDAIEAEFVRRAD